MKKKNQEKMKKKIRKISSDLRIAGMQFMKNMIKLGRTEPPQFSMASCDHSYSRWIYRNSSDISSFERFTGKQKRIKPVKFEAGCWLFSVFVFFLFALTIVQAMCVCFFGFIYCNSNVYQRAIRHSKSKILRMPQLKFDI